MGQRGNKFCRLSLAFYRFIYILLQLHCHMMKDHFSRYIVASLPKTRIGYKIYIVDVPERSVLNHVMTNRTDKKDSDLF